jgi:hypothetical protein
MDSRVSRSDSVTRRCWMAGRVMCVVELRGRFQVQWGSSILLLAEVTTIALIATRMVTRHILGPGLS